MSECYVKHLRYGNSKECNLYSIVMGITKHNGIELIKIQT